VASRQTTTARTLIDLASVLPADMLEEAVDDALARNLVSPARLKWQLQKDAPRRRRGISMMRTILADRGLGAPIHESVLETRAGRILRNAGIEGLVPQYEIRDGHRLVARVDFAIPDLRIAIEVDGYRWHAGRARWERDLARRNAIAAIGWQTIHLTSRDLAERAARVVAQVQAIEALRR
jgi:very-short-patch-repair endonuclease